MASFLRHAESHFQSSQAKAICVEKSVTPRSNSAERKKRFSLACSVPTRVIIILNGRRQQRGDYKVTFCSCMAYVRHCSSRQHPLKNWCSSSSSSNLETSEILHDTSWNFGRRHMFPQGQTMDFGKHQSNKWITNVDNQLKKVTRGKTLWWWSVFLPTRLGSLISEDWDVSFTQTLNFCSSSFLRHYQEDNKWQTRMHTRTKGCWHPGMVASFLFFHPCTQEQ